MTFPSPFSIRSASFTVRSEGRAGPGSPRDPLRKRFSTGRSLALASARMGIAGSPLRDHVIFIEGAPRSGTTWLQMLLATHPDIAGLEAESHLFNYGLDHLFDNFDGRRPRSAAPPELP